MSLPTRLHAVESGCAIVLPTSDKFVAIRSGPSANSAMVEKLSAGQIVRFATSGSFPRGWFRVDSILKIENGKLTTVRDVDGWANERLLQMIECG